jgi:protein-S-isoprenylcysteine O-methyltransferase Ste14
VTGTRTREGRGIIERSWHNIPLPEPHLAGILGSGVLRLTSPWKLPGNRQLYRGVGWTLVGAGIAISALAVRAASEVDMERPSNLVTRGPYAISRNPMYVGWTLLYLGVSLATRNAWMVASIPTVAGLTHSAVMREEYKLERVFGEDYACYQERVHRYL